MSVQQDSAPEYGGKGSFPRTWNSDKFRSNYDGIDWGKKRRHCCFGLGLWAIGHPSPMGPMDGAGGMPTIACPECGANKNPLK